MRWCESEFRLINFLVFELGSGGKHTTVKMATSTQLIEENENNRIREGFICPICMEDLVTVDQLLQHFEEAHDTEEDKDVLQSFKGN